MSMDRLTFLGDVFLPERYTCRVENLGQHVLDMEYPITHQVKGYPGKIQLKIRDNYLTETFGHPPAAVRLANNRILDYRKQGFEDTLRTPQRIGLNYFGAGYSGEKCNSIVAGDSGCL